MQFEWASPLSHRQTWTDMASGNAVIVGITDGLGGRSIYKSSDGKAWTAVAPPTNVVLRKVIFADGLFIAVGNNNTILTSPDGADWSVRHTDSLGAALMVVAVGNGATVAVGYNAQVLASTDLKKWTPISGLGYGYSLLGVKFTNGRFVAIGQSGQVWISTDGFTWTQATWPAGVPTIDWSTYSISFGAHNGTFALSLGAIFTSTDGIHWKNSSGAQFGKIVETSGGFLGVEPTISKSVDGIHWDILLDYAGGELKAAAAFDGGIVAGGLDGLLFQSADGKSWDQLVSEVDNGHDQITFGNETFLRFGSAPGVDLSANGSAFESVSNTPTLKDAAFGNGVWVGVGNDGGMFASADAREWESMARPIAARALAFANGVFVAETALGGVDISMDGRTWKWVGIGDATSVRVIGNNSGRWAVILDGQRPATSEDGEHWTIHPAQEGLGGGVTAAGNGRFIAISGGGMGYGAATWSTDGIAWQREALMSGTTYNVQSLTFGGGVFLLTDDYGDVFSSVDGINWTGERQAGQAFTSAAYGNGRWLVSGGDSVLRSVNPVAAKAVATLEVTPWSLILKGTAGDVFQIETTSTLGREWSPWQAVAIPAVGRIELSMDTVGGSGFFRARAQ